MAAALTEEDLQQSAVLSADNVDDEVMQGEAETAKADSLHQSSSKGDIENSTGDILGNTENRDPAGSEADALGEEGYLSGDSGNGDEEGEDDASFDEDADGDDDDDGPLIHKRSVARRGVIRSNSGRRDDNEDEDEDEGVGAVKIKPGQTDDEEEESGTESSSPPTEGDDDDSDDAAEWQDAADNEQDEDSDAETPARCIFCKQDEDDDPGEEFETYLTCAGCGEHAHQQCARDADALTEKIDIEIWQCPACVDSIEIDGDSGNEPRQSATPETTATRQICSPELSPASKRSSTTKLTDLLPSQRGNIRPDSHSVFDQLVVGDPTDGSRTLRKRKSFSVEDEEPHTHGRKRRKTDELESPDVELSSSDGDNSANLTKPTPARTLRLKVAKQPFVKTLKRSRTSWLIGFRMNSAALRQALESSKIRKRSVRGEASRPAHSRASNAAPVSLTAPFISTSYSQPFYSFFDKETDDMKGKPYGGILNETEADTSKTLPLPEDRRRFDEAKQTAEHQWRERIDKIQADIVEKPVKKPKKSFGLASQIECIEFGGWEIDTWYAAPYPEEYSRNRVLYICEFCLKYMNSDYVAWRHKLKCPAKHPPGDEIYRHGSVSMFEVDGRKNPVYCQNLCLLAKLFLGSKTLYYDVEPFLFYVLCEYDEYGYHFVGYFSKEKRATSQNNVSCILTLPIHQRKGYGNLLIDFSYLLTRVEQKTGSPEKPLSDMGLVSYRNYWRLVICQYLLSHVSEDKSSKCGLSIRQISDDTGLTPDDVISALEGLRCLVREPQTELYAFRVDIAYCREYVAKWESKKYVKLEPRALTWTPYIMGRGNAMGFELGPPVTAIAPRDEDEAKTTLMPMDTDSNGRAVMTPKSHDMRHRLANGSAVADFQMGHSTGNVEGESVLSAATLHTAAMIGATENDQRVNGTIDSTLSASDAWMMPYTKVAPTRFQVFPTLGLARRQERGRPTVSRTPLSHGESSSSRPKRSVGRVVVSLQKKDSTSRRKSGGTGRGPGRWPKGTKKSDYGNADSGPGLPPAWIERQRLASLVANSSTGADADHAKEAAMTLETPGLGTTKGAAGQLEIVLKSLKTSNKKADSNNGLGNARDSDLENIHMEPGGKT